MVKLAGHLDQLQLAEATRRLELLGQAAEANDIVLYLERDMDFHLYLVQLLEMPSSPRWCVTYERLNECRG